MRAIFLLAPLFLSSAAARADVHPPIVDRNYSLDLYTGAALGSTKIVGMGGTGLAIAEGSASVAQNPAAAAVRSATSTRTWDWDWHLDWLNPELGSDFDGNGDPQTKVDETIYLTLGLLGQWRSWGLAISGTILEHTITLPDGSKMEPLTLVAHLVLARSFFDESLTLGLGLRGGSFSIAPVLGRVTGNDLFTLTGGSIEAGSVWQPKSLPMRVGLSAALPVSGDKLQTQMCDPMSCAGFILPNRLEVPWQVSGGIAFRHGATPWNQKVQTTWRDERELVVEADVSLAGAVSDGEGLEAFLLKQLQASGRQISVSPRAGVEYEWVPGWFRVRAGTYWEPGRFFDTSGRIHATGGLEVRLFSFGFWGSPYRLRASFAFDGAEHYGNAALSVGFWH